MRKQLIRTALLAIGCLGVLGVVVPPAGAVVSVPKKARSFSSWMARAFDQCTPSVLTVLNPSGLPTTGCIAANAVTDSTTQMNYARIRLGSTGRLKLFGKGFTFGDVVRVRLNMRVTRRNVTTKHPPGVNTVTFADVSVDCPPAPDAFTVRPNGAIVASTDLAACLAPNNGLAAGPSGFPNNIEILGASLINAVSGKELARTGVVR